MRTVTITLRGADFAVEMVEMRTWLDQHMLEPARFTYRQDGEFVVISVDFQNDHHAEAFRSRFGQSSDVDVPLRSPANIILVHDDPEFVEGAAAALSLAGHKVVMFKDPTAALTALEAAHFEILIARARFPVGQPNGVALAKMARMKQPLIKVVFTVTAENVEYTEGIGEVVTAPIDIAELVASVAKLASG